MSKESDKKKEVLYPELGKRLESLIGMLELNQRQFALKVEANPQTISHLIGGYALPAGKTLLLIAEKWPAFNATWLLTGEGEPFPNGVYGEKKAKQPFLPGGEVNSFGATVHKPGGLAAALGKDFGEDTGGLKPNATPAPSNAKEFIQSLLAEITGLKRDREEMYALFKEQQQTIKAQQGTIAFMQDELTQARQELRETRQSLGKADGNQTEAPGLSYAAEPPVQPIGFKTVVRAMYPDGLPMGETQELKLAS